MFNIQLYCVVVTITCALPNNGVEDVCIIEMSCGLWWGLLFRSKLRNFVDVRATLTSVAQKSSEKLRYWLIP